MTYMQALLGFALVAGSMALVPGLDMMMVLHETINTTRARGLAAVWGISCGVLVWAVAAAVGLAALISAFPMAYDAIRVLGGLYLFYLAFSMARKKKSGDGKAEPVEIKTDGAAGDTSSTVSSTRQLPGKPGLAGMMGMLRGSTFRECAQSFWRGFLTDFFNPKIGVFYIAIIPQFLVPGVGNLEMGISLGMVHFVESVIVLTTVAYAASFFAGRLRNERSQRILGLVSGGIMAILGGVTIADVVKSRL
ncbi:LysE family translocator [Bifidobacterium callimiconis]|uniref:Lysine transporter LysE n=1 Tax=Bifidobacterium callimiconis TaxID=2306973 RepID=A0A430FBD5_9BIFI|nr:LysE family translocator [Bifidobacterium callimiconis]MBT1177075.1 LysE family translocator [Bifidobacterium callimiconis]RSX50155.1 lysine transporter LysE [Bifidobacterium callimiconis]